MRVVARAERAADHHRQLRHVRARDGRHHFGAVFGDAARFVLAPDHEAGDVLQEHQRNVALAAQLNEMRALQRGLAEQNAVVGDDANRITEDSRETAHERRAIQRFELIETTAIDDARDHFAHIERLARIDRNDAVELFRIVERLFRRSRLQRDVLACDSDCSRCAA